jgi:preprotein translocase subunit SecE
VAKAKSARKRGSSGENPVIRYFRQTRSELRKVHWPTRQEAWNLTKIIMAVTVAMAVLLGLLDYLFSLEMQGLIARDPVAIGVLIVLVVIGALVTVILRRQTA